MDVSSGQRFNCATPGILYEINHLKEVPALCIKSPTEITSRTCPIIQSTSSIKRFEQLAEDNPQPPIIILVEPDDDITDPKYAFLGERGLLSDEYETYQPRETGFSRVFEWVAYWPELKLYEALYLRNVDNGYWILIPETIVDQHPDLKYILTDESLGGLSEPQPLY